MIGPGQRIRHGQNATPILLDGIAGDTLLLQGESELYYEWQTEQRDALDMELRALIVATDNQAAASPVVRFRVEFGQGAVSYNHPPSAPNSDVITFGNPLRAIVPARGLVLRVSARQFRVFFLGGFDRKGGVVASNKIQVSAQPAVSRLESLPMQDYAPGTDPSGIPFNLMPFPMASRMFRVRDVDGQPFFPGAAALAVFDSFTTLLGSADVASGGYGDWTPVPPLALTYGTDAPATVEFR